MTDAFLQKNNREEKLDKEMNEDQNMRKLDEEEQELINRLYSDNYDTLLGFAANSQDCRNAMAAEDVVHDAFCEAIRKIDEVKVHENPGGWLMQTVKYKLSAEKKKFCSRDIGYEDWETEPSMEDNKFEAAELNMLMESELNEHERKLIHLYYDYGYTAKEIAARENITDGNFKVRMCRIKKKMLRNVDGIWIVLFFICLHWIQYRL